MTLTGLDFRTHNIFVSLYKKISLNKPNEKEHFLVKLKNLAFNGAHEKRINCFGTFIFSALPFSALWGEYFGTFISIFLAILFQRSDQDPR